MTRKTFISEIHTFVLAEWRHLIAEGEEKYSRFYGEDVGSPAHVGKIKEFAQLKIVSHLVTLKGSWLSTGELKYALFLFDQLCDSFEYFDILKYEDEMARPARFLRVFLESTGINRRRALEMCGG